MCVPICNLETCRSNKFKVFETLATRIGADAQIHCNRKLYAGPYCSDGGFDDNRHYHIRLLRNPE